MAAAVVVVVEPVPSLDTAGLAGAMVDSLMRVVVEAAGAGAA